MVNESRIFLQSNKLVADASFSEDQEEVSRNWTFILAPKY